MKKVRVGTVIRWILTLALICGAYHETGPFTAGSLFLVFFSIEVINFLLGLR